MPDFRISATSLHALRRRLSATAADAAALLSEAGAATGHALARRWAAQVESTTGLDRIGDLDHRWLEPLLSEFLVTVGWGRITIEPLAGIALLVHHPDCPEADPAGSDVPVCHFTAGALAALLSDIAGAPLAVIEVACGAWGEPDCQFLVGSPDLVGAAGDLLSAGGRWRDIVSAS